MKCDRNCFDCKYADCVMDDVSQVERNMQDYRDASIMVTGNIPKAHRSKNSHKGRKGERYD